MINFGQVLEGWRNKLIPPSTLKELIEVTAEHRLKICAACHYHSKNHKSVRPDEHCTACGCTLSAKTRCLTCSCPFTKWIEVATDEQGAEIKKAIDDGEQGQTSEA